MQRELYKLKHENLVESFNKTITKLKAAISRGLSEFSDPVMDEFISSCELGIDLRFEMDEPKEIFDWEVNSEVSHIRFEEKSQLFKHEIKRIDDLNLRCSQCGATTFKGYICVGMRRYDIYSEAISFTGKKTKKFLKTVWGFTRPKEENEAICKRCKAPLNIK